MADRAPDDLVLVRRDDLRTAFTAAKFYGALTSPRADRLEVAVNGEAATVEYGQTVHLTNGRRVVPISTKRGADRWRWVGPWTTQETP